MTFEEANQIMNFWGDFLAESFGKLNMLFAPDIPESFLPYPKDVLLEALNIMGKYYFDKSDKRKENLLRETAALLPLFCNDEQAITKAAKKFNNSKWKRSFLPGFKNMQNEWLELKKTNPFKK